jgi:large subunit ribosomal protein L1
MGKKSKRYRADLEKQPKESLPLADAVVALKKFNTTKFDQTVEVHMRLGVDANQADQIVRGSLVLPHGIGKTQRVVVFAKGDAALPLQLRVPMKWAATIWRRRSKMAGPTLMSVSPLRT